MVQILPRQLARPLARSGRGGPPGFGHAQPQFGLAHDGLRLAVRSAYGRAFSLFRELVDKPWLGPPPDKGLPGASSAVWDAPRLLILCDLLRQSALYGGLALWAPALVCLLIF